MIELETQIKVREELKPLLVGLDGKGLETLLTRSAFLLDKIASTTYFSQDAKSNNLSGELSLLRYSGLVCQLVVDRSPYHLTSKGREVYNQIKESGFYQSNALE